jgi:hypothetical protein
MNIFRWIFFLPVALASALLVKLAWDVSNKLFLRFEPGILGQWTLWGIGEVIGILAFFYVALRIVPTRKKTVAYALCGLGLVLGLLTVGYLVYLFSTLGIHSDDPRFRQDIIQGLGSGVITASTTLVLLVSIRKRKLEHWLQTSLSEENRH